MAEKSKEELVEEAQELGVPDAESLTKQQLLDELAARVVPEAGPVVPSGQTQAEPLQSSQEPVAGVQPLTADEIPEAGR